MSAKGRLTMAATHLGNPLDIPPRSLEALRSADLLIFEEDRPARSFLKTAGVHRDYRKYSEHREADTLAECVEALGQGRWVVYMSDQGTPGLADPGKDLVEQAYRIGAKVEVIPGPSSVAAAIAACPFACANFAFVGFPPRDPDGRARELRRWAELGAPLVIMDTPYRLGHLLETCAEVLVGRRAMLALDVSGPAEAYLVGELASLRERAQAAGGELNFVLIIEGRATPASPGARPPRRR